MHGRTFFFRRWLATVLVGAIASAGFTITAPPLPARASSICPPVPGKDGVANFGSNNGVENSYFIPAAGTVAAGATTLTLSSATPDTSSGGNTTAIAVNDELLVIQMQGGSFNSVNSSAYGGGGSSGNGYTSIGKAGLYEYVYVSAISGTAVTIVGGTGGGLVNSYTEAAATASTGQQTYQIVRVPQYLTATLTSAFHASYWNGKSGGVAALDIASTTNLGGATIYATGNGFRGGAYTVASTTPTTVLNNDFMDSDKMNGTGLPGQGTKGEGFLGTPQYLFYYTTFTTSSTPAGAAAPTPAPVADGYPGGDMAMGAPGNAGGGGTDSDPVSNDQNTGGGGGGNGGAGGHGGYPWTPNYDATATPTAAPQFSASGLHTAGTYTDFNAANPNFPQNPGDIGGRGAVAIAAGDIAPGRVLMGGGGGAGVNNNASNNNSYNAFGSSGGVGGGIVMMRIAQTSGTGATIYANGTTGLAPLNDGGGGGGAGGTVVVTSPSTFTGVVVNVNGAAGTTANASNTGFNQQHGPGGGGGGGVAYTSSSIAFSATGGAAGTTTTFATTYGAQPGTAGFSQIITPQQIPGVASGAECYSSGATLLTGPASNYSASGSYDGTVPRITTTISRRCRSTRRPRPSTRAPSPGARSGIR